MCKGGESSRTKTLVRAAARAAATAAKRPVLLLLCSRGGGRAMSATDSATVLPSPAANDAPESQTERAAWLQGRVAGGAAKWCRALPRPASASARRRGRGSTKLDGERQVHHGASLVRRARRRRGRLHPRWLPALLRPAPARHVLGAFGFRAAHCWATGEMRQAAAAEAAPSARRGSRGFCF